MSVTSETQMETKILDFIKQNGKCTALKIAKALKVEKKNVNSHLYNLEKSNQLSKTNETPPVWDLKKETDDVKPALKSDSSSLEKELSEILKSGGKTGLKAHEIARDLGQPKKAVKKHLYSLQSKGEVQRTDSNSWTSNNEKKSLDEESKSCDDFMLTSDSGLSQRFEVIAMLGEGGFGCVFKVQHKIDGKTYALKIVKLTKEADSEVKALARLKHPNIVLYITCWPSSENWTSYRNDMSNQSASSFDVVFEGTNHEISDDITSGMESLSVTGSEFATKSSENDSTDRSDPSNQSYLFIQMEFCEGGTLTSWITEKNHKGKQRNTTEIHEIFHGIVSGVEYIHSNNLIHRDLKPDNILFDAGGKVKIGDFGLVATLTNPNNGAMYRTKGRGTTTYMSPEQENQTKYDEKTDIFPLGLIWFEMLWKLSTGMERIKLWPDLRKQTFPAEFCDRYPTEHNFLRKMLSDQPADRPQATEIKENLEHFFSMQIVLSQKTV